jgi:hypothetical protein
MMSQLEKLKSRLATASPAEARVIRELMLELEADVEAPDDTSGPRVAKSGLFDRPGTNAPRLSEPPFDPPDPDAATWHVGRWTKGNTLYGLEPIREALPKPTLNKPWAQATPEEQAAHVVRLRDYNEASKLLCRAIDIARLPGHEVELEAIRERLSALWTQYGIPVTRDSWTKLLFDPDPRPRGEV